MTPATDVVASIPAADPGSMSYSAAPETMSFGSIVDFINGKLYVRVNSDRDRQMYSYDGTTLTRVTNINSYYPGIDTAGFTAVEAHVIGSYIYFTGTTGNTTSNLYAYDGQTMKKVAGLLGLPGRKVFYSDDKADGR